jgi:hypothetical protein
MWARPISPRDEEEWTILRTTNDFDRIDNEVFLDPSQTLEDFRSLQTGNVQVLRCGSYGYNYQYLGSTRSAIAPEGAHARFPVRSVSIRAPSRTIVFADSAGSQDVRTREGFREHAYTLDPPRKDPEITNSLEWGHDRGVGLRPSATAR